MRELKRAGLQSVCRGYWGQRQYSNQSCKAGVAQAKEWDLSLSEKTPKTQKPRKLISHGRELFLPPIRQLFPRLRMQRWKCSTPMGTPWA
ncbi:hypothetical protein JCM7447_03620 [Corynebacterium amycolatum]